jgi:CRP-like cAMP-binding protein
VAISSQKEADETNNARRRRPWEGVETMIKSRNADYLGLTIETISRTLTQLKQDGLIALPTATRNRDQFEELAADV